MNGASAYLSRLKSKSHDKRQLTIRHEVKTCAIPFNLESSHVANNEKVFFLPDDTPETEFEMLDQKRQITLAK